MGCFQVFEDHEGIEADLLRSARCSGRQAGGPLCRSAARPAGGLPPAPLSAAPSQPPAAPPLLPGDPPLPELELQAASAVSYGAGPRNTPHYLQPDRRPAVGCPPAGTGHRSGAGGGRQEFPWRLPLPASPPQAALAVAGALLLLGVPPEQLSSPLP